MNLNKVIVVGNLTRDPEVRTTPNGQNVCSFSVATNRYWNDQQGQRQSSAEYHNIVAWSKLSDVASQYLKKGSLVMIEGRLQTRNWEGQDGVKRYRTEIITENIQLGPRLGASAPMQSAPPSTEEIPTIQQDEDAPANLQNNPGSQTIATSQTASESQVQKEQVKEEVNVENIPF